MVKYVNKNDIKYCKNVKNARKTVKNISFFATRGKNIFSREKAPHFSRRGIKKQEKHPISHDEA